MEKKFKIDWSGAKKKMEESKKPAKKDYTDSRFFVPSFKDDGWSKTIIRFLPAPDCDVPYVEKWHHYFKNGTKKFFQNCPTTIKGEKCPVCEYNKANWDSYSKEIQMERKRKAKYFCNILIVKDPVHPENNGKVFLYSYGAKIQKLIDARITDDPDGLKEAIWIWDYYDGANFELFISKTKDGNNYDTCKFSDFPSAIGTDEEIEKVIKQLYPIKPVIDPKEFTTYDKLEERLNFVLGEIKPKTVTETKPVVTDNVIVEEEEPNLDNVEFTEDSVEDLLAE